MPMQVPFQTYGPSVKLTPLYRSQDGRVLPVNLPPLASYPSGQILVQAATGNDVQTIIPPGSGNYVLTFVNPVTGLSGSTTALAAAANDATVQSAIQSVVTATGGGTVTVASLAATFSGLLAARPIPVMTTSAGSVAHTATGATTKTFAAYTGTGSPSMILEYPTATDASGNTVAATGAFFGPVQPYATAFYSGTFNTADLVGLDANAVTKMGGVIVVGGTGSGTFNFG